MYTRDITRTQTTSQGQNGVGHLRIRDTGQAIKFQISQVAELTSELTAQWESHSQSHRERPENKRKTLKRSRNKTHVFLVVIVISFGGFLPFVITRCLGYEDLAQNYKALILFFDHMGYLNSAINPVVDGFMYTKFRNELPCMYHQLKQLCSRTPWLRALLYRREYILLPDVAFT